MPTVDYFTVLEKIQPCNTSEGEAMYHPRNYMRFNNDEDWEQKMSAESWSDVPHSKEMMGRLKLKDFLERLDNLKI